MRAAIIGMGVVGRAQAHLFGRDHELVTWDVAWGGSYPYEAIGTCDFAVVCAGTPATASGSAQLHGLYGAVDRLAGRLPVLIRSTVPPGTTDELHGLYGGIMAHCPEFLTEREGGAMPRSEDVPFTILGGDGKGRAFFAPVLHKAYGREPRECTALDAELAKYTANLYWAMRVTFVNEMARICELFDADWGDVRYAWLADERVNPAYTQMGSGFEPGFGGRCWPKDLDALIEASKDEGYRPAFLEAIRLANKGFRREGPARSHP